MTRSSRPRAEDAPRWRCSRCGCWGTPQPGLVQDRRCYVCADGELRPAPSLAVERAERAVVRAAVLWTGHGGSSWLTLSKCLVAARVRAAHARRRIMRGGGSNELPEM